ncbi:hypothetical protein FIBSPDRAFT_963258 [Athelia psychrophila]|uniref:Ubiquitin-like protease family profile domain-containing protein n=1 Tax=Athelia psychrophila TaxID=1759441 RepID=A0A165Z681_9AGAM|nr:hypothetical protein FIBSPDRAFT_963258 [Fibularhizoctonia sp. CBS 109695]
MDFPLDGPLRGFPSDAPSLSSIFKLLGENWLGKHIIDAYIHLVGQRLNQLYPHLILFLNCYFHLELANAFERKQMSPMLKKMCNDILTNPPLIVAFVFNKEEVHWAATSTVLDDHIVLQGDSAGFSCHPRLRDMMQWLLADVAPEDGPWLEATLPIEQQGPGSGSCGIASTSSIIKHAVEFATCHGLIQPSDAPAIPVWTDGNSQLVRSHWIQSILCASVQAFKAVSAVIPTETDIDSDLETEYLVQNP